MKKKILGFLGGGVRAGSASDGYVTTNGVNFETGVMTCTTGSNYSMNTISFWFRLNSLVEDRFDLFGFDHSDSNVADNDIRWFHNHSSFGTGFRYSPPTQWEWDGDPFFAEWKIIENPFLPTGDLRDGQWHHLIISRTGQSSGYKRWWALDGVDMPWMFSPKTSIVRAYRIWVGGLHNLHTTGKEPFALQEVWMDTNDLEKSDLHKFIDARGKPKRLGPQGEAVTGSSPLVYLANSADNFHINRGTGGDFTVSGSLSNDTTSPTD